MSVLTHSEIDQRFVEIFKSGGSRANIRAAKYYLTLGIDYLILPDGRRCPPGKPHQERFSISPGQSAVVSTEERLLMPGDLIGVLGSRFDNAEHGMLFFGGMIVDPGYGLKEGESLSGADGEPLTFTIGNVGNKTIELRPGEDVVASIAFLELKWDISEAALQERFLVRGPARGRKESMEALQPRKTPPQPLGFVEELQDMRTELDKVKSSVGEVVLFGIIVLAATLCAAITTAVIAISSHEPLRSPPLWENLGLTLGCGLAAVILLVGLAYLSIRIATWRIGINRKIELPRPYE